MQAAGTRSQIAEHPVRLWECLGTIRRVGVGGDLEERPARWLPPYRGISDLRKTWVSGSTEWMRVPIMPRVSNTL